MRLVVGRIGRAHGIHGDVFVEPFTDEPDDRFAPGTLIDVADGGALTVATMRWHSGRMLIRFDGVDSRTAAEELRGSELTIDVDPTVLPNDPDEFYDYQLVDLSVRLVDGTVVGQVAQVVHLPGQDLLEVERPDGGQVLIPFVTAIVPEVDILEGTITITPPAGLIDDTLAVIDVEDQ